jgi:peroxin-6
VKFIQEIDFKFRTRKLHFHVRSIPNKYFDFLCGEHEILSDHTIFINRKVFDYYIYQQDVNFINLLLSDATKSKLTHAERVMKDILDSPDNSNNENKTLILHQVFPLDSIPINKIFMKENAYWNFVEKYKLNADHDVYVNMKMLAQNQKVPAIATKANIFLVNSPYDVPTTFIDDIFKEYFSKPRLLYRNHTYRIDLTEEMLGNFIFCDNFQLITRLKRIYFKCVHIESRLNPFETCGIVLHNLTTLTQSTTISYQVPKQMFCESFTTSYPLGLKNAHDNLKSSIMPFICTENSKEVLRARKIYPIIQILGDRGSGKRKILQSVADSLGIHVHYAECCDIVTSLASQTEQKLLYTFHRATSCQPIILCFNDFELFGRNNEGHEDERVIDFFKTELDKLFSKSIFDNPIVVVALVNSNQPLKSQKLNELFLETINMKMLEQHERFQCLLWYHQRELFDRMCFGVRSKKIDNYITMHTLNFDRKDLNVLRLMAEQTQGFLLGDLRILYQKSIAEPSENFDDFHLSESSFSDQLKLIKKCFSDSIGTPEIPRVLWDDIGGLAHLKKEIQNSIELPLKFSHLLSGKNLKRSGILFFGPPVSVFKITLKKVMNN